MFMVVLITVTLGGGWLFVTVRDALGFVQKRPLPIGATIVNLTGPFIAALIYSPIRKRVAMFSYKRWMKSFDEPPERGDVSGRSWWYSFALSLRSLGRILRSNYIRRTTEDGEALGEIRL